MDDVLSVIVARPLVIADGVIDVARAWSRLGLLRPMAWVDPSEGSDAFKCELIIRGESTRSLTLERALSWAPYSRLKLISTRLATSEGAFDVEALNQEIHRCERVIVEHLANGFQNLERLNLIIPIAGLLQLPSDLVVREWNTNVVVAPEDRVDPRYADRGVREDHEYFGHAMAALAGNGGLWTGLRDPLPSLVSNQSTGESVIRVTRSYARAIFGDDVTAAIVEGTLSGLADLSLVCSWRGIAVDENPRLAVVRTSEQFLLENATVFDYVAPPKPVEPERVRTGGLQAIKEMVRFIWEQLKGAPARSAARFKNRVISAYEGVIQAATYGSNSVYVVKVGDREIPNDLPNVEIADSAAMVLERIGLEVPAGATSNHWDDLRRSTLALIDPAATGSRRDQMIVDVDCVVGRIGREPMVSAEQPSYIDDDLAPLYAPVERAADPIAASELCDLLESEIQSLKSAHQSTQGEVNRLQREARLRGLLGAGGSVEPDEPSEEPSESRVRRRWYWPFGRKRLKSSPVGPVAGNPLHRPTDDETLAELNAAEDLLGEIALKIERLESDAAEAGRWRSEQDRAVMWRVGDHLRVALVTAIGEFRKCLAAIVSSEAESDEAIESPKRGKRRKRTKPRETHERRTKKRIGRALIGALLVALGGVVGIIVISMWFLASILVAVIGWCTYSIVEMWKLFRQVNRLNDEEDARARAINDLPLIAMQVVKLDRTYVQFLECADLMATMLHPTINPPDPTQPLDLELIARPASCQFVEATGDRAGILGAVARTGRTMFAAGWTDRWFLTEAEVATNAVALELGLSAEVIDAGPFTGVHQERIRAQMTESLRNGSATTRWRQLAGESVAAEIGTESLPTIFPFVEVDGSQQSSNEFFEVLTPIAESDSPEYFGLGPWATTGLRDGATKIAEHFTSGPAALTDPLDGSDFIAVKTRLDISGPIFGSHLKLFPRQLDEHASHVQLDPRDLG